MDNHNESQKVQMLKDIKNAISLTMNIFSGHEQHVCKNLIEILKSFAIINRSLKNFIFYARNFMITKLNNSIIITQLFNIEI
jgi:hypothetical protein